MYQLASFSVNGIAPTLEDFLPVLLRIISLRILAKVARKFKELTTGSEGKLLPGFLTTVLP
jgi:hypothetical protein